MRFKDYVWKNPCLTRSYPTTNNWQLSTPQATFGPTKNYHFLSALCCSSSQLALHLLTLSGTSACAVRSAINDELP